MFEEQGSAGRVAQLCDALGALPAAPVLRPAVHRVLGQPPGPGVLAAVLALADGDLTRQEALEVAGAWERLEGTTEAGELLALADLQRTTAAGGDAPVEGRRRTRPAPSPTRSPRCCTCPAGRPPPSSAARCGWTPRCPRPPAHWQRGG